MKKIAIFAFLILINSFSFGQTYKGIVKDSKGQPIAFANVIVESNIDDALITGVITDENGQFEIEVNSDKPLLMVISFIGYKDWKKEISEYKNIDLGEIVLQEINNELDEVIITGERPIIKRKVDRLIFNIEKSVIASGGNAIDVLQKTPGVRMDGDNIGLIGKSSVRILINNRLSPLAGEDLSNYLRSLSSEDISRIEVITNPPAKYEAGGNSGLVNIVFKKIKKDFFEGNIRGTYSQATYPSGFLGGGITYQKNKWSIFSNINSGDGSIEVNETNKIFYTTQTWDTDTKIRYFTKFLSSKAGIDYNINENTSIGIQYIGTVSKPDNDEKTVTNIFNSTNSLDSLLLTGAHSDKKTYFHSLNGHLKTVFDTIGKTMAVDVDYFIYNNNLDRVNSTNSFFPNGDLIENSTEIFRNTSNQDIESFTSGIDFEWPMMFTNLEFGGKLSYIKNNSDIEAFNFQNNEFTINSSQSNIFEYIEKTQAVYVSASKSLNKWDFKIGSRLEFTQTEGNSITLDQVNKNDYTKLFPTAYITYNPNDNNSWSLNYGKRISRPSYSSLNPFRWYSNPYSYTEGNPFLQPSFVDNFELSYLYKNNLNSSLYVSITENGTDQVTLTDSDTNIQATVRRNFLEEYVIGLSQSYTFSKVKWFESYLQYDIGFSKIKSNIPNTIKEQDGVNFYFSVDNSFYFNNKKTFLGELNFWYSAPGVSGVDYITESYATDIGFKWLLFEKQFQISLVGSDVFSTYESTIKSVVNTIRQEYKNYYDRRQFRVSMVYRFGNSNIKSKSKRFSNEEERRRTD